MGKSLQEQLDERKKLMDQSIANIAEPEDKPATDEKKVKAIQKSFNDYTGVKQEEKKESKFDKIKQFLRGK